MFFAGFEGLSQQIASKLHEFIDAVMIDEIPFLMQKGDEGLEED